ncbi:Fibronectin type III domain protein [Anaerohalosphaera lusitana]|uniref:Fibronectin type III domain protein n=1 Tax=Anaerohalosphaera lusitana TaxID=1936003 RepID=A0A1U9NLK4_9BACT|nr:LamG domain-containing protein [Anaerohalosphaera lusitana]AQT68822.1 Fibronectin type III domain protein [Anaerohalosphaera lusitana]
MRRNAFMCVMLAAAILVISSTQAGLYSPPLVNTSFEDATADGWFHRTSYFTLESDTDPELPDTPYGEYWVQFGNQSWMYQQIGTWDSDISLDISLISGKRAGQDYGGLVISLWAGGDPSLAANASDNNVPPDTLVNLGAVMIDQSQQYDYPNGDDMGSFDISFSMSTGSNGTAGEPLWLLVQSAGRKKVLVDNIQVNYQPKAILTSPENGAEFVARDADLRWQPPESGSIQKYILTYRNDPDFTQPGNTVIDPAVSPYDMGTMPYSTTYYWRVDTVDGQGQAIEGDVWSFTTAADVPTGLFDPPLVNSSFENPVLTPAATSADVLDWYDSGSYTMISDEADTTAPDTPYGDNWAELGNERWIYQQIGRYEENLEIPVNFLLGQKDGKDFTGIHVSLLVGGDPALAIDTDAQYYSDGNPLQTVVGATEIANSGVINPFATTAVKASSQQSVTLSTGTGYVEGAPLWLQFNKVSGNGRALIDNVVIGYPVEPVMLFPTYNLEGVNVDADLEWAPPMTGTVQKYILTFGTDPNLTDPATTVTVDDAVSPYDPGELDYLTTYYWRVDAVNDQNELIQGYICPFTTEELIIPDSIELDDFQSYADNAEFLSAWQQTAGSQGTHELNTDWAAMQLNWQSSDQPVVVEVERTLDDPLDAWPEYMHMLTMSIKGSDQNPPAQIFITLSDGVNDFTASYTASDPVRTGGWHEINIPIEQFTNAGIDMQNITLAKVGLTAEPDEGLAGSILIDDISFAARICGEDIRPAYDLNDDCTTNLLDIAELAKDWLVHDYAINPDMPNGSQLAGYYQFDELTGTSAADSSTNSNDGVIEPGQASSYWSTDSYKGSGSLAVSKDLQVMLPADLFASVTSQISVSMWVKGDIAVEEGQADVAWGPDPHLTEQWQWVSTQTESDSQVWTHYAFVIDNDAGTAAIYRDGILIAKAQDTTFDLDPASAGQTVLSADTFDGTTLIDELKVYSYALGQSEIAYLATDGTGSVVQPISPLFTECDFNLNGVVDLADLAKIVSSAR